MGDIVVFLGLKTFNSDNFYIFICKTEMRKSKFKIISFQNYEIYI